MAKSIGPGTPCSKIPWQTYSQIDLRSPVALQAGAFTSPSLPLDITNSAPCGPPATQVIFSAIYRALD